VEILDLRHFASADLRPLLEHETATWARLLCWDYRASADMILRYVDAKILPGYAAVENGRVAGYAFFVYEGSKGVIGDLYVANGRGNGRTGNHKTETEAKLLTHVIETLQQSPGIHRIEAQLLTHEAGSIAPSFVREGFGRYPRLFMALPLAGELPDAPLPDGVTLRRWSEEDFQPAAALITACYRGHIDAEINDQYRSVSGSMRFLNNIVRFPGCGTFDAGSSFVAHDQNSRALVGLILCSRVRDDVGHITQVCVLPEQRKRGIGEALIATSAAELERRNFATLSLTVTQANDRAVALYERLGFGVKRVFDAFVWEG
jgi:ribosomal protein S18 acetylase RimI-like enzyme